MPEVKTDCWWTPNQFEGRRGIGWAAKKSDWKNNNQYCASLKKKEKDTIVNGDIESILYHKTLQETKYLWKDFSNIPKKN